MQWGKLGGHDYEGAIAAVNRLAQIALTDGKLDEAEAFIRRAIESTEKTLGLLFLTRLTAYSQRPEPFLQVAMLLHIFLAE